MICSYNKMQHKPTERLHIQTVTVAVGARYF